MFTYHFFPDVDIESEDEFQVTLLYNSFVTCDSKICQSDFAREERSDDRLKIIK